MLKIALLLVITTQGIYSALNCREDHCINCIANVNYTHSCGLCRYSRTTRDGDCHGGISIDRCESYTDSDGLCKVCEEDYYLSADGKSCNSISIDNCRWGFLDSSDSKVKCSACDGTYPSNDHKKCTDDEVPDECMYGGHAINGTANVGDTTVVPDGERYCWACKKGWSRSANSTQCISPCAHGCYYCNLDGICTQCDKYNGYYEVWRSRDYGYPKCEHGSSIFKISSMLITVLVAISASF